jgi:hypothetical protein
LAKNFTPQTEVAKIKTYSTSRKANLKRDRITYISGGQEQLIELLNFNMCSTSTIMSRAPPVIVTQSVLRTD